MGGNNCGAWAVRPSPHRHQRLAYPQDLVHGHPVGEPVVDLLSLPGRLHQIPVLQELQVVGHQRWRLLQHAGQLPHAHAPLGQRHHHPHPLRVRQGLEHGDRRHLRRYDLLRQLVHHLVGDVSLILPVLLVRRPGQDREPRGELHHAVLGQHRIGIGIQRGDPDIHQPHPQHDRDIPRRPALPAQREHLRDLPYPVQVHAVYVRLGMEVVVDAVLHIEVSAPLRVVLVVDVEIVVPVDDQQISPWSEEMDPIHVSGHGIGQGPYGVLGDYDVERELVQVEMLHIGLDEHDVHMESPGVAPGPLQHLLRIVDRDHIVPHLREEDRRISGAGADVEHPEPPVVWEVLAEQSADLVVLLVQTHARSQTVSSRPLVPITHGLAVEILLGDAAVSAPPLRFGTHRMMHPVSIDNVSYRRQ